MAILPSMPYVNQDRQAVTQLNIVIDNEFETVGDRILMKLSLLEGRDDEDMAFLGGVSKETMQHMISVRKRRIEQRVGARFSTLRAHCQRWRLGLL